MIRTPFPDRLSKRLVIGILAYRLQANVLGDLGADARKTLAGLAKNPGGQASPVATASVRHKAGTVYEREYDGRLYRVTKTATGFSWEGRDYASLSAVARAITGTRWNGHRFFGLSVKAAEGRRGG